MTGSSRKTGASSETAAGRHSVSWGWMELERVLFAWVGGINVRDGLRGEGRATGKGKGYWGERDWNMRGWTAEERDGPFLPVVIAGFFWSIAGETGLLEREWEMEERGRR